MSKRFTFVGGVKRLIQVIRECGPVLEVEETAPTDGPGAADAADNTVNYGLHMTTETPETCGYITRKKKGNKFDYKL